MGDVKGGGGILLFGVVSDYQSRASRLGKGGVILGNLLMMKDKGWEWMSETSEKKVSALSDCMSWGRVICEFGSVMSSLRRVPIVISMATRVSPSPSRAGRKLTCSPCSRAVVR